MRPCTVPGCGQQHVARGLCPKHYAERNRRKAGVQPRGERKDAQIEFLVPSALLQRFHAVFPEGERSEVLRAGLERLVRSKERRRERAATSAPP